MELTEQIRSLSRQIMVIIIGHTALILLNNYTHEKIDLVYALTPYMPILLFFCFVPLAVVFLLSTRIARLGAIALLGILPSILIYNIVTRFAAAPSMNQQEPSWIWKVLYEGSFGLMCALEVIAFWLMVKILKEIHIQMNQPSGKDLEQR